MTDYEARTLKLKVEGISDYVELRKDITKYFTTNGMKIQIKILDVHHPLRNEVYHFDGTTVNVDGVSPEPLDGVFPHYFKGGEITLELIAETGKLDPTIDRIRKEVPKLKNMQPVTTQVASTS
jgi:hypothetical protein